MVSIIRAQDGAGLLKDPKVTGIFIYQMQKMIIQFLVYF
jgi:hypothetical protein